MIQLTIPDKDCLKLKDGPWLYEADFAKWVCPKSRYECIIVRVDFTFTLCGYIGVPLNHPLHGVNYSDELLSEYTGEKAIKVHGGLTYSGKSIPNDFAFTKKPNSTWFFGFDCAHSQDLCPALTEGTSDHSKQLAKLIKHLPSNYKKTYRTMAYVKQQVALLALQMERADIDISTQLNMIMNTSLSSENDVEQVIKNLSAT